MPRFSARGRSVSAASSAMSDRSTGSRVKDRWSARLSRSNASVRSIARVLTAWRRSTSSPLSRFGSLRATSRSVWVIASGVRSSWEALAANRCCSASCASSRASMVSKASASSRNSSLRPSSRIRWESDPFAGQARGLRDAGQRGEHPAGEKPPAHQAEHQQERQHGGCPRSESVAGGRTGSGRSDRGRRSTVGHIPQQEHPHAPSSRAPASMRNAGVAEGELEANAQTRRPSHGPLPHARCPVRCRCGSRRRARWR